MVRQYIQLDTVWGGGGHATLSLESSSNQQTIYYSHYHLILIEKTPYQFEVNIISLLKTSSVGDVGRGVSELSPVVNFSTTTELYRNRLHKCGG